MSAPAGGEGQLPADVVDALCDVVEQARASGRTRFLAWVFALPALAAEDGIRAFAWAGVRDRYYWERVDAGELVFAWGSVDELEGEGQNRFGSVRAWQHDLTARLVWVHDFQ